MSHVAGPLADQLSVALTAGDEALRGLADVDATDRRDRVLALQQIYALHRSPIEQLGDRVRWQHHPVVCELKGRLELDWIAELDATVEPPDDEVVPAEAMRRLAAIDRAPAVYRWLADRADWDAAMHFLALEGGPDDLFDDLVATCQVGLPLGPAKLELAGNYWDELGNGEFDAVHNVLYQRFVEAVGLPTIAPAQQPTEALERAALVEMVAVNRALQPEMVGVLGLIELQAGPHCRYVEQGLDRLGAPAGARDFYSMHAVVDPVHGKGWTENAVAPLADGSPDWGPRMLRGAAWKAAVNRAFFDWAERTLLRSSEHGAPPDADGGPA